MTPLADQARARLGLPPAAGRRLPARLGTVLLFSLLAGFCAWALVRALAPETAGRLGTTARRWLAGAPGPGAPPTSGTLPPGAVLGGNYRVERELGRGGMGVVYEATDLTLHRRVAIKQLKKDAVQSPEDRERFLREARIVAALEHSNLARILAPVHESGEVYLVFEFVDGRTLSAVIDERGPIGVDEARRVLADVCSALQHAHSRNVIHRDLKPANVMLEPQGRARVMDFGIAHRAKTMSRQTATAAWGTPPYMPPEQERGRVSAASDLYALGVMTYEMLTGELPFPGPDFLEQKTSKTFRPATAVRRDLPSGLDVFFARALDPEPAKRFASAADFLSAFDAGKLNS